MDEVKMWILAISSSEYYDIDLEIITGTEDDVRARIIKYIWEAIDIDESYAYGSERESEIEKNVSGYLYGYSIFTDRRIDYVAYPYDAIPHIRKKEKMSKIQRIEIPLSNGKKLVAEEGEDGNYKEIYIFLQDGTDVYQDLAIVGEEYNYSEDLDVIPIPNEYSVKVYADEFQEDFTHDFKVMDYSATRMEENDDVDR